MDLYKNKYRIPSARLKNWDYRNEGSYFITICTKNMRHFFGHIKNKEMILNDMGRHAWNFWNEIPKHFPFVELDAFQIMPNHMHGILMVHDGVVCVSVPPVAAVAGAAAAAAAETLHCNVCTRPYCICNADAYAADNSFSKNQKMSDISPKAGSVSTIFRS